MRAAAAAGILLLAAAARAAEDVCAFHQVCFPDPDDPDKCTPTPTPDGLTANGTWQNASFPMDVAHNFSIPYYVDGVLHQADPIVCPQYQDNGCCTMQSNAQLYSNFLTMVNMFAINQGCLACAVNLVNWWCGIVCSPNQSDFVKIPEPPNDFEYKINNLGEGELLCLVADVYMDLDYACALYDSCKDTGIASQMSAMSSALGFLNYQAQTGAVSNGNEWFNLHFVDSANNTDPNIKPFSYPLLDCHEFADPGSINPPYYYPPHPMTDNNTLSCECAACEASCDSGSTIDMTLEANPISPLHGFQSVVVFPVYAVLAVVVAGVWWRRRQAVKRD